MGYVGNQQAEGFVQRPTKQDLTGATGDTLTLTHAVSKEEDIDLYINNVKQEPTTAYTVADTAVTLTGDVVASDDIYVVYNSLALQTVVPPDGSVTSAKLASGAAASNLGTSVNLATIKDSTGTNTAMSIDSTGRILTPARPAFHHSSVTGAASPITGDLTFNTEIFDSGGVFDNTVFTAPVTGLYQFSFIGFASDSSANGISGGVNLSFEKSTDGGSTYSTVLRSYNQHASVGYPPLNFTTTLELNASDKIKLNTSDYIYADGNGYYTRFSGYLIG